MLERPRRPDGFRSGTKVTKNTKTTNYFVIVVSFVIFVSALIPSAVAQPPGRDWPAVTREAKPWTRWWWQGSAVDAGTLTTELRTLAAAGFGGVEITPIYGVRGEERRFMPYLSGPWVTMLEHALGEARAVDLGVDMATGTGWPFGGPSVGDDTAARNVVRQTWTVAAGGRIDVPIRVVQTPLVRTVRPLPRGPLTIADVASPLSANADLQALAFEHVKYERPLPLLALVAYDESGRATDLTARVGADGRLDWTAPRASTVYGVFGGWHGKLVERAAPGGEGFVLDHFSADAIRGYLAGFDRAFAGRPPAGLRAFFNDSYEVDDAPGQADWTPRLFDEFQRRRGYDLREHLPELFGDAKGAGADPRILADYRETVSDLLLETFTAEWAAWAKRNGAIVRNQAHGSPANLLDLYAASDIPETEGTDLPRFKWASSAGHVAGRRLIAAEAATWLDEHFRATLAQMRTAIDHFYLAGVNHIVYHGTAYSPPGDPWPGWQFYASVEVNPRNAWWDDLPALNAYVARTQSLLQGGRPDSDVLLYFPFHEAAAERGADGLLAHFGAASQQTAAKGFEAAATLLQARGYAYDYVSDRQLRAVRVEGGRLVTAAGTSYAAVVIPFPRFMPIETLQHAVDLSRRGARVVVWQSWPGDVSGFADRAARQARMQTLIAGASAVIRDPDLEAALTRAGVGREPLVDRGLMFTRRVDGSGRIYFVANRRDRRFEGWVPFRLIAGSATIFDAMSGRRGRALTRAGGPNTIEIYLELAPGESLIVAGGEPPSDRFDFFTPAGAPIVLGGPWQLRFVKGGPSIPAARTLDTLLSWTALGGDELKTFAGTGTYTVTFPRPSGSASRWQIDLGAVRESARVRLNGRDLATLIGPSYRVFVDADALSATNTLEVSVTNLSANRIADLDRRGVPWKKFYNVNMPARFPENLGPDGLFTAAAWEPLPSGLLGPVTLTPVTAR